MKVNRVLFSLNVRDGEMQRASALMAAIHGICMTEGLLCQTSVFESEGVAQVTIDPSADDTNRVAKALHQIADLLKDQLAPTDAMQLELPTLPNRPIMPPEADPLLE